MTVRDAELIDVGRVIDRTGAPRGDAHAPPSSPSGHSPAEGLLTARELADAVGITYRQLDHWTTTGLLEARQVSRRDGEQLNGSGSVRLYARGELDKARLVLALLNAGLVMATVRGLVATRDPRAAARRLGEAVIAVAAGGAEKVAPGR